MAEPLWIDELHSAWVMDHQHGVIQGAAAGNQTPIYYVLANCVCGLLGKSEFALRLPSLIFGIATIPLGTWLTWRATHRLASVWITGLLLAIDSSFVFWATEARPYAMLQFFVLLQYWSLQREFKTESDNHLNRPVNVSVTLLTGLLPLIHLSSLFLIGAQFLYYVLFVRHVNSRSIFSSFGLAMLLLFCAQSVIAQVLINRTDWSMFSNCQTLLSQIAPLLTATLLALVATFVFRIKGENQSVLFNKTLRQHDGAPVKTNGTPTLDYPSESHITHNQFWLLVFSCFIPIIFALAASLSGLLSVASPRYISGSLILLPILAGVSIAKCQARRWHLACAMALIASLFNPVFRSSISDGIVPQFRNEDWNSVIQRIQTRQKIGKPLVFLFANLVEDRRANDSENASFLDYLKFPLTGIYSLNDATIVPMPTLSATRWSTINISLIRDHGSAIIVARVSKSDYKCIVDELQNLANAQGLNVEITNEYQANNNVRLGFISVIR